MTTVNKFALRCFGGNLRVKPDMPQKGRTTLFEGTLKAFDKTSNAKVDAQMKRDAGDAK